MRFPNFCGPTYQHRSADVDNEICMNLYPEVVESAGAKASRVLISRPGREVWLKITTTNAGGIRGMYVASNQSMFVVAADELFKITIPAGVPVATSYGSIGTLAGRVQFADNGIDMVIADGQTLWRFNFGTLTLSSVANAPANPSSLAFVAGRIYANDGVTNVIRYSELYDAVTWPSLNELSSEISADPLSAIHMVNGEVWAWGPTSYEAFRPSGNPDLPIVPAGGSQSNIGIIAPSSVATVNGHALWIGGGADGRNIVYMSNGYNAVRVSDHAREYAFGQMATVSDAIAWTYSEEGHWFYILQFPTGNRTFAYDMNTNSWHERSDRNKTTNVLTRWRPTYAVLAFDTLLCGDDAATVLYRMDLDLHTDEELDDDTGVVFTKPIARIRRTPILWDEMKLLTHKRFILDCSVGVGLTTGQGSDPQAMLRFSDDAGRTWSNERWASIGAQGAYGTRAVWNLLGASRKRVYEVVITDPVKVVLIGAEIGVGRTTGP